MIKSGLKKFREASNVDKILIVVLIVIILIFASIFSVIGWMIVSPLFVGGGVLNEDRPEGEVVRSGFLNEFDSIHKGVGEVQLIYNDSDDQYFIFFNNVSIANGPDLILFLSKKMSFSSTDDKIGETLALGRLPATDGNFSVSIDSEDVDQYNSLVVWCDYFLGGKLIFTYASLTA